MIALASETTDMSAPAEPATRRAEGSPRESPAGLRESAARLLGLLDRPLTSYYLILGCTLLLLGLGLAMVLSTSSAYALDHHLPTYGAFQKQLAGAAGALVLMWLAARASPRLYRAAAYPVLALTVFFLVLVLAIGHTVLGATREISVAGLAVQPSEFAKLAFVLWGADLLARKDKLGQLTEWRQLLVPLMPGMAILALLVLLGNDLGTTVILLMIFLTLLWVIGSPGRLFIGMLLLMGFIVIILMLVAPYRLHRFTGFLDPNADPLGAGLQELNGMNALGSGGPLGVGLGRQPVPVGLGAREQHRHDLRHPRGRARPGRHPVGGAAVQRHRLRRRPHRAPDAGHLHAAGRGRGDGLGRGPGGGQHGRRPRPAADYRHPAPAGLRGTVVADHDHDRARHADGLRPARARRDAGT